MNNLPKKEDGVKNSFLCNNVIHDHFPTSDKNQQKGMKNSIDVPYIFKRLYNHEGS